QSRTPSDGLYGTSCTSEIEYIVEHAMSKLDRILQMGLELAHSQGKAVQFLQKHLRGFEATIGSIRIQYREELISDIRRQLSEQRSLAEYLKASTSDHLMVDPESFQKIERSRSSHSRHMQRNIETLMKLQAFRIQKKRLDGGPFSVGGGSN
ncbi:MAG: hypothetical protein NTZ35_00600, partial [Ignavibacteriales bacterium]|nr:hypothetical protein [Ignavibacteriales bacterium]